MGLFDFIQQGPDEPLRGDLKINVRFDPETGQPVERPWSGEDVRIAPNGAPYRVQVEFDQFHDCGHSVKFPLGGRYRCGRTACVYCLTRCAVTHVPLCPSCARLECVEGRPVVLCTEEAAKVKRRRIAGSIGRAVLGFFIETRRTGR